MASAAISDDLLIASSKCELWTPEFAKTLKFAFQQEFENTPSRAGVLSSQKDHFCHGISLLCCQKYPRKMINLCLFDPIMAAQSKI